MKPKPINRMRVFAGPNGSGKSAVHYLIQSKFQIGHYINADDIERTLAEKGFIHLDEYGVNLNEAAFQQYLAETAFLAKSQETGMGIRLRLKDNVLTSPDKQINSYEAAFVAELLRQLLIEQCVTFSFETVFSHPSKLDVFRQANEAGFRCYLYFVCTENPAINQERIRTRVIKGGHSVPLDKIAPRYFRSLELLAAAAKSAYRTYVFDNSGDELYLAAEFTPDRKIVTHVEILPDWVKKYFFDKLADV